MMDSYETDIQGALNYVSLLHDHLVAEFLELITKVPTFGDTSIDKDVSVYVDGLGQWVRGNDCWSFEVRSTLFFLTSQLDVPIRRANDTSVPLVSKYRKPESYKCCPKLTWTFRRLRVCSNGLSEL